MIRLKCVFCFCLFSCTHETEVPTAPVKIGVIVSLSGGLASVGPHLANSASLAAREVNAAGGLLNGRPVELVIRDDRTDPAQAAAVAQQMIEKEDVVAIVGSLSSTASLQVQALTFSEKVPQISCCSSSPDLTKAQPADERFFFRTVPSDLLQSAVVAQHASTLECQQVAILHLNDSYGGPFGDAIAARLAEAEIDVSMRIPFQGGQPSYFSEVEQIAFAEPSPDCIALVAFPVDGGTILSDWHALRVRPDVQWIGTDGIKDRGVVDAAGNPMFVDGVLGTAPITAPETRFHNDYAALYAASYRNPPGVFGGSQYDAMAALLLAIEKAGQTDGTAIRNALFEVTSPDAKASNEAVIGPGYLRNGLLHIRNGTPLNYEGASGPVDINQNGDVVSDYEIWRYDANEDEFVRDWIVRATDIYQ